MSRKISFIAVIFLLAQTAFGQNVGIGITTPTSKLHVNGGIKLEGLNLFEFGAGIVGKEVNAGKIGYNAFGANALTIVGAGTSALNRSVYFFAEGGTTFNGPVTGLNTLQISGEITRPSTGATNLVPIAFGLIDGTTIPSTILNGSGNFSVIRSAAGFYVVTINGEFLTDANHTAIVSCVRNSVSNGTFLWSTANTGTGTLLVLTGNGSDQKFSFVVYKP